MIACRTCAVPGLPRGTTAYCHVQLDGTHIGQWACLCADSPDLCPIDVHRIAWLQAHPMWPWRLHEAISALPSGGGGLVFLGRTSTQFPSRSQ